jgi:hypothetical protein
MRTPVKYRKSNLAPAMIIAVAFMACPFVPLSAAPKEADSCAAKLTASQKLIYSAVKPKVAPKTKLNPLIRSETIALVKAGKISRSTAPKDAQVAATCLKMLQS